MTFSCTSCKDVAQIFNFLKLRLEENRQGKSWKWYYFQGKTLTHKNLKPEQLLPTYRKHPNRFDLQIDWFLYGAALAVDTLA